MFSLNSRIRPSSSALRWSCRYKAAVLDRRRDLAGDRRQQTEVLAVERFVGLLAAEREHRDRAPLEQARDEIVDAGIPPGFDFLGEESRGAIGSSSATGVPAVQPRHHRRAPRQARHRLRETVVAN
jgi:hypothetical protein